MTATEYAKQYEFFPNYHKIALDAFNAGVKNAESPNIRKLKKDLFEAKKELRDLWKALNDPEKCGELIGGL